VRKLNGEALANLPAHVGRPNYRRSEVSTGIVHFGPGAFHRAHQSAYIDRILSNDPRWGIAAVSLRSPGTVESLKRQEGLYTLAILDSETSFRVNGAHNRFFGPGDDAAVRSLLADPAVRFVSSTVTEKGYCFAGDGTLDFDHPDIVHDLAASNEPRSLVGWLALGLRDRWMSGQRPFTPLCCDNMAANGRKLGAAVDAFARRLDPVLADWIGAEVRFPNSMVDSITPATDERARQAVRTAIGFEDEIPVSREAYTAWVIEDILPEDSPDFGSAGIVLTHDVAGYERAKLRILNGAHSSLAYLGLLLGHETVADAMADDDLARFIGTLVSRDIIPTVEASLDLETYSREILNRFLNPAIGHKLSQIAWDGSQKLPYRLLDTIGDARKAGRPLNRLAIPIAAWMLFVERQACSAIEIVDPLAIELAAIGRGNEVVERLLALRQVFPEKLAGDPFFRNALVSAVEAMRANGPRAMLEDMNART
jgi:fructuronate reductase